MRPTTTMMRIKTSSRPKAEAIKKATRLSFTEIFDLGLDAVASERGIELPGEADAKSRPRKRGRKSKAA